jgi:hypothetical protein
MTPQQRQLLENVLDALDRLFDRASTPVDIYALIFATSEALKGSEFSAKAETVLCGLENIVRSDAPPEEQRELALGVTNDLRIFLAEALPFPG